MNSLDLVYQVIIGFLKVCLTPLFYVAIILVFVQYWRQNNLERQLFGIKVTSAVKQTIYSVLFGVVGGLIASACMAGLGVVLNPTDFTYVWLVAVGLALFQLRWICFAYAGGLLSIISLLLNIWPVWDAPWPFLSGMIQDIRHLSVVHLLALVAVLHLIEALLVYVQGGNGAAPVFLQGKRGRLIGGFLLQKFWVIPLSAIVVTGGPENLLQAPSWWPILPVAAFSGLQVLPIPAILGFSGIALARTPKEKSNRTAVYLGVYALILLGLAIGSAYLYWMLWLAALFSPIAHEWLIRWELADEQMRQPRYVKSLQGLRILEVLPGSPAESMGLLSGEVVTKVNGMPVSTPYDLHFAINQNPAFVKLEVLDQRGEVRFANKPLYSGDHHGLGLILVPDEGAQQYVKLEDLPLWKMLWNRLSKQRQQQTSA